MKALFFDFDGLILDTETPEWRAWEQLFAEHGVPFPADLFLFNLGRGPDQIEQRAEDVLAQATGLARAELHAEGRRRTLELIAAETVRPGVVPLLDEAAAEGLPCWVVSSSERTWVEGHLGRLGLLDRFGDLITRDLVTRAKPSPDLYLLASERIGIAPADAVAFEDSPNGVTAARAAGIWVVAVPNAVSARLDLSHASAQIPSLEAFKLRHWKPSWGL